MVCVGEVAAAAGAVGVGAIDATSATDGKRVLVLLGFDRQSTDSCWAGNRFDWR